MSGLAWSGGALIIPLLVALFRTWWKNRVHRENVDRVCTCMERQARAGHPVADASAALRAIRPVGLIEFWTPGRQGDGGSQAKQSHRGQRSHDEGT